MPPGPLGLCVHCLNPIALVSFGLNASARSIHVREVRNQPPLWRSAAGGLVAIIPKGPAAYFATIDADAVRVARAISEKTGIPAEAHGYAAERQLSCRIGFIHVPAAKSTQVRVRDRRPDCGIARRAERGSQAVRW